MAWLHYCNLREGSRIESFFHLLTIAALAFCESKRLSASRFLAISPSRPSKRYPNSAFWNSFRCLLFRFTSITNCFLTSGSVNSLVSYRNTIPNSLHARNLLCPSRTIPSLLTIIGTIIPCSETIDCFKDSNSDSETGRSKLRYSFLVDTINSTNHITFSLQNLRATYSAITKIWPKVIINSICPTNSIGTI
jgi:hypothetical protein